MLLILLLILPIWFVGFKLTRLISSENRLEVIVPVSLFGSTALFILFLNLTSYIFHPTLGIYIAYIIFFLTGLILLRLKKPITGINLPNSISKKLLLLSILIWAILLFRVVGHVSLSGDPTLYTLIAKSFTRGNFPIYSPWQPDIQLAYHYGPSIFMGVFHLFSGSSFDLIQRSTAFVILLMLSTFLSWVFKRHLTIKSLIAYQLIPLIILISLGNWMIAVPKFPFELPPNFTGILDWLSKMPSVEKAFSTYGGAIISLQGLIFFYHELVAVASFVWILWLSFTYDKNRRILSWTILTFSVAALSIINEAFVLLAFPSMCLIILCKEFPFRSLVTKKNVLSLIILSLLLPIIIIFQGGVPTGLLTGKKSEYPTLQFFPDKKKTFVHNAIYDNYNELVRLENTDLQTYQLQQQSSRLFLPTREKWLPFIWFHPGVIYFYLANFFIFLFLLLSRQRLRLLIFISLLTPAITTSLLYNLTFSLSNYSSRLLALTYTFLGINLALFLIWTLEDLKKSRVYKFIILTLIICLAIPSLFPNMAWLLSIGEKNNKLISPDTYLLNSTENWLYNNLPFNARLLQLSSSITSPLIHVGVFTPIWLGDYKDYSIDKSPQYFDLIYTLNPTMFNKFKITYLLIDYQDFQKLPEIRKEQLKSNKYFSPIFSTTNDLSNQSEERIYKINDAYIDEASDLPGTFAELSQSVIPREAKVYVNISSKGIENWSKWEALKRALVTTLKDRSLYFDNALPGYNNQFYTHQETKVSGSEPSKSIDYDYLALSYINKPEDVCSCNAQIIWKGFDDFIVVWKVLKKI